MFLLDLIKWLVGAPQILDSEETLALAIQIACKNKVLNNLMICPYSGLANEPSPSLHPCEYRTLFAQNIRHDGRCPSGPLNTADQQNVGHFSDATTTGIDRPRANAVPANRETQPASEGRKRHRLSAPPAGEPDAYSIETNRSPAPLGVIKTTKDGRFTERELQIVTLLAQGKSEKQIARELGISRLTVNDHLRHARARFDVHKSSLLVISAMRIGAILPSDLPQK